MGVDSNAHSQLYGPDTNKRGEAFEEFILMQGLLVENRGTMPTFETIRGDTHLKSHIDVTLSKGNVRIVDWAVCREYNGSDHNTISWSTLDKQLPVELIRPWKKACSAAMALRLN